MEKNKDASKKSLSILAKSICLCVCIFMFATSVSYAETLKDKKKNVQNQINENQQAQERNKTAILGLNEQIRKIDKDLEVQSQREDALAIEIANLNKDIENNKKEIDRLIKKQEESQNLVKKRIRALYVNGNVSVMEILLSSQNIMDFFQNYNMLREISKLDAKLMSDVTNEKKTIETLTIELEQKQKELDAKKQEISKLKNEIMATKQARSEALSKLDEDQKKIATNIQALREEQSRIDRQIAEEARIASQKYERQVNNIGTVPNTGKYYFPIDTRPVRINAYYGESYATGYPGPFHTGIDINAAYGTNFKAMDDGIVIVKKELNYSYGHYVVIEHPGKVFSLYAHASRIYVNVGDRVKRGQTIAAVGSTGNSTGPHAHFEIHIGRYYNRVNPLNYYNKGSLF